MRSQEKELELLRYLASHGEMGVEIEGGAFVLRIPALIEPFAVTESAAMAGVIVGIWMSANADAPDAETIAAAHAAMAVSNAKHGSRGGGAR